MNPDWLLKHFEQISEAPEAVPRLRRFILDLAVRGKLVEQNPKDEPAAELVKRIAAERDHLVKLGEIRKEKPLMPIEKEALPFDVPQNWSWARLRNVTSYIQRGKSPKYASGDGPLVISQKCVQWDGLHLEWAKTITPESLNAYEPIRFLRDGDLLWNSTGTGTIGRVIRIDQAVDRLVADSHVTVVRCLLVDERFVGIWLRSDHVYGTIEARAAGATNQVELTAALANNQVTPLPPLAEQHRIVAKVDELMALCDKLEAARAKREKRRDRLVAASLNGLNNSASAEEFRESASFYFNHLPRLTTRPEHIQQLRQTILNLAVRGKLVGQNPEDEPASELVVRVKEWRAEAIQSKLIRSPRKPLKEIGRREAPYSLPDGWAWARLGEVIYIQSGDGLTAANMKDGDIPVYGGNGINGHHDTFNIEEPTIVIGRVGYYCGSIHVTPERAWVTDNAFITKFCSQEIFRDFLVLLLKSTNLKENEKATAQPVISGSKIYPIVVGIPPLAEQHRIVAKVDELLALCDDLEARLTTTATTRRQLFEATLYEALSGYSGTLPEYPRPRGLPSENGGPQADSMFSSEGSHV